MSAQLALDFEAHAEPVRVRRKRDAPTETLKTTADYVAASLNPSSPLYVALGTYDDEKHMVQQAGAS